MIDHTSWPAEPKSCPSSTAGVIDSYIEEIDQLNKRLDRAIENLEIVEALTTDPATARRIRSFLQEEGIWPKK